MTKEDVEEFSFLNDAHEEVSNAISFKDDAID